jgi:hypothetical protein
MISSTLGSLRSLIAALFVAALLLPGLAVAGDSAQDEGKDAATETTEPAPEEAKDEEPAAPAPVSAEPKD